MSYIPTSLFEVAVDYQGEGQLATCVFHYANAEGVFASPLTAQEVVVAFQSIVQGPLLAVQANSVRLAQVRCIEILSGVTLGAASVTPGTGNAGGEAIPFFNAYSFISPRVDRSIGAGHKRIPGVTEEYQVNGQASQGQGPQRLAALAVAMSTPIAGAGDPPVAQLYPVIWSKTFEGAVRAQPLVRLATNWSFQRITSQLSRKS